MKILLRLPSRAIIRQVFAEELDLALREPFNELLTYLYSVTENIPEKQRLETWVEILRLGDEQPDTIALKKMIFDNFITVADLFEEFPSAAISLAPLLELLPKQKPRLYSISSCPLLHPREIQITVGVLQINTDSGKSAPESVLIIWQDCKSVPLFGLEFGPLPSALPPIP